MTYYVKNDVRGLLTGNTSSTAYDTLIDQEGPKADKDVENDLYAYSGATPPFTGGDITTDITSAANIRTAARVQLVRGQIEIKKALDDEYDSIIKRLIMRFKATPTTRTTTVSVQSSYRSEPLASE